MIARLGKALPEVAVVEKGLAVLPPDVRPELAAVRRDVDGLEKTLSGNISTLDRTVRDGLAGLRETMQRDIATLETGVAQKTLQLSLDRAARRLQQATVDLERLAALPEPRHSRVGSDALKAVQSATRALDERRAELQGQGQTQRAVAGLRAPLDTAAAELRGVAGSLSSILGDQAREATGTQSAASVAASANAQDAAEALAVAAERVAAVAAAAVQATAIRIPPPYSPSAQERLIAFARSNAVFFGNDQEFRDAEAARTMLDTLSDHIKSAKRLVRVVGYTDERGTAARNSALGRARADKVVQELAQRGVAREMLVAVGRGSIRDISTVVGEQSANRRVEFEVGFEGEVAVRP
jgi:outer membrane protein OmpA-like peptidoglycan-associated protein